MTDVASRAAHFAASIPGGLEGLSLCLVTTPVRRRILGHGAIMLDPLHEVVQAAFGCCHEHLHEFEVDGTVYRGRSISMTSIVACAPWDSPATAAGRVACTQRCKVGPGHVASWHTVACGR